MDCVNIKPGQLKGIMNCKMSAKHSVACKKSFGNLPVLHHLRTITTPF